MKQKGEKIPMLTAYDYTTAKLAEEAGIPILLVGDSLGMVVLGHETTIPVTLEEMIHHTKAVVRGTKRALVVGDMPFMTYHTSVSDALRNAARFIQEAGAQAVKLEGGVHVAETVRKLVNSGIPVMGHIGLTPQSVNQLGGHKLQGKSIAAALAIIEDAKALEDAGAFSIVFESIPAPLSKIITEQVSIPTIGIAAGPYCDGQVQVVADTLGLYSDFVPRHAKQYAKLSEIIKGAFQEYIGEVTAATFPTPKNSFSMNQEVLDELQAHLATQLK
jgi:3-methyl-2-oxobutanoate hydroxymethyltransferase